MKKLFIILLVLTFGTQWMLGQENETEKKDKPVRAPFDSPYLLENQTTFILPEKTLEMAIQHKFGTFENGMTDIYGIYNSANIRLGFDYVPITNVQIGYGLTRTEMTHDFNAKWTIFEQTRKNTKPFALALFGNVGINGQEKEQLGMNNAFEQRLSMFGQLILSRKFGYRTTLQLAGSYSHFNMVNIESYDYDRFAVHFSGRVKAGATGAIIFNYDQPLDLLRLTGHEDIELNPNLSIGYEFITSTHDFQVYMGYTNHLLPQHAMVKETKDFEFKMFNIGFLITRLWAL